MLMVWRMAAMQRHTSERRLSCSVYVPRLITDHSSRKLRAKQVVEASERACLRQAYGGCGLRGRRCRMWSGVRESRLVGLCGKRLANDMRDSKYARAQSGGVVHAMVLFVRPLEVPCGLCCLVCCVCGFLGAPLPLLGLGRGHSKGSNM